jgi:hypothetical protein
VPLSGVRGDAVNAEPLDRLGPDGFVAERMTFYAMLYPRLREVARQHGYALALHGSLTKDLDVIAVPWVADAADEKTLVRAIVERAHGMVQSNHRVVEQPHGRRSWTIMLGGNGGYLDLSVMPRVTP